MKMRHLGIIFVLGTSVIFLLTCSSPVSAYRPPDGADLRTADLAQPNGHGRLTLQAVEILQNDGYEQMAAEATDNMQEIMNGLREEDYGGGVIRTGLDLLLVEIGVDRFAKNSFSHFYNPDAPWRKKGLIMLPLYYIPDILLTNEQFVLRGPHPAAHRLADWYYALAVRAMRNSDSRSAYLYLGRALGLVQNLSIPQYAVDAWGLPHHRLGDYESYADGYLTRAEYLAVDGGYYRLDNFASQYCTELAEASSRLYDDVSWWHGNDFDRVNRYLLPLAQKYSAGLLRKFYERWQTEAYSVFKLTINGAAALDDPDGLLGADLFASLNVLEPGESSSSYSYTFRSDDFITGYIGNEDRAAPNDYLNYDIWTFPYTSETVRQGGEVEMVLGLWDDDGHNAWNDDDEWLLPPHWIDINPSVGYRLTLKLNFQTGEIKYWTGSAYTTIGTVGEPIEIAGNQRSVTWTGGGRGVISFTIDTVYVPAAEISYPPDKPVNVGPGTIGRSVSGVQLSPMLVASRYTDPNLDPQSESEWTVLDTSDRIVYQAYGGANRGHIMTRALEPNAIYKWKVRYRDNTGLWSEWSRETLFWTDRLPEKPINQRPVQESTGVAIRPLLVASAYVDPDSHDHLNSQWEISIYVTNPLLGPMLIPVHEETTTGETQYQVPAGVLNGNNRYFWRVRYRDQVGLWSEWSDRTNFTTALDLGPPIVTQPPIVTVHPTLSPTPVPTITLAPSPTPTITPVITPKPTPTLTPKPTPTLTPKPTPTPTSKPTPTPTPTLSPTPTPAPSISVIKPKAGESLPMGSKYVIEWHTEGSGINHVALYFSPDDGKNFYPISEKEVDDGFYDWIVFQYQTKIARIRVIAYNSDNKEIAWADSGLFMIY